MDQLYEKAVKIQMLYDDDLYVLEPLTFTCHVNSWVSKQRPVLVCVLLNPLLSL